ncbi:MAG TPA: hypothetical protein VGH28_30735 [Polyangiaceae bacterium]|jgi:hypothetical protein
MSSAAEIRLSLPAGYAAGDLASPDFSQSPRLALEQWQSARDTSGQIVLAWGCAAAGATSWSADATELAQGKLAELASSTAARMASHATPMHVVATADEGRTRALAVDGDTQNGTARTFVAFTSGRAHGCFVLCTDASCEGAVREARVEGALVPPPSTGLGLRTLGLAVHHPRGALAVLGAVLVAAAAFAIATRPRVRLG